MHTTFSDTQDALREAVADLLSDRATREHVRAASLEGPGFDSVLWRRLVAMGVNDLPGTVDQGVVAEELGRVVAPVPYVEHVVAMAAIRGADPDHRLLPALAEGDAIAVFAEGESVQLDGAGLHGYIPRVPHGAGATHLVARVNDGDSQLLVLIDAEATTQELLATRDRTRPLVSIALDGVAPEVVGRVKGLEPRASIAVVAPALYAHDLVGVGQACLDLALAHACIREQFGKPIVTYEAVSHRLAGMFVELESARSHAYDAALAATMNEEFAPLVASLAKATASDAAVQCAEGAIQVHGGIGFTWEHDLHLFLGRARSGSALWGSATYHRGRIADHLSTQSTLK